MATGNDGGGRTVLEIDDLRTYFHTRDGIARAVDGVSISVERGETLSIVGESGCGKSVTAMSVLRLLPIPPAKIESGRILFEGEDLLLASEERMRQIRGNQISMIFQEPMTSLNPVMPVGRQIAESLELHQGLSRRAGAERAVEMIDLVQIPEPRQRSEEYPHQLSGGMRQRVMIAMALACNPAILIADEPTTALDVTIQAQILDLMLQLKDEIGAAIVFITHDLGVVAETAQRVVVMYAGRKVEEAAVADLFARPLHPYTLGLMGSIPTLAHRAVAGKRGRLNEIPGVVPSLRREIPGCAFAPRCPYARERCRTEAPVLETRGDGRLVACWEWERVAEKAA